MSRRLDGRNGEIWRAYCSGATQEALADEYGISQPRVSEIIAQVRASIPPTDIDAARAEHVEFLQEMRRQAALISAAPARPKYANNGMMMRDEDGNPILDNAEKLNAMKTAVAIGERAAKLLGLDAAAKVDVGVSEAAASAAAQAAADAIARLHGNAGETDTP
jgi:hypothetical protein